MPTVEQNLQLWNEDYDWSRGGEEWGVALDMWDRYVGPTVEALPGIVLDGTTLEIAPGYGRMTPFLLRAKHLILVDLSPRCIEACAHRFRSIAGRVEFHVNDGSSLAMVADDSVDFAFSWDSLVHVEMPEVSAYIDQLAFKLRPGGYVFLHHSNVAGRPKMGNHHGRATTTSATRVGDWAVDAGLEVAYQRVLDWGGDRWLDCLSVLRRPAPDFAVT